jgi:hypothetical protein
MHYLPDPVTTKNRDDNEGSFCIPDRQSSRDLPHSEKISLVSGIVDFGFV